MRGGYRRSLAVGAAGALSLSLLSVVSPGVAQAASGDVVISELMYHAPDPSEVEFIELFNRGSAPVDVSGWFFGAGITIATPDGAFPTGTVIPAGGRIVGTSDLGLFKAQYGFDADFSYAGTSLSNGGEQVTLNSSVTAGGAVVDEVSYDDADPWPVAPDGGGPSLELVDAGADNAVAASWAPSSVSFGTPRAVNTAEKVAPASVSQVSAAPARPAAGQSFVVSAKMAPNSSATLTYKVMFGAEVKVAMRDDAASPGGAGDGVYAASVPGAQAGELVRYRVDSTQGAQTASYPAAGDSRSFDGVVVADPSLDAAKFPVLQWFMADADYNDLLANHRCDGVGAPAVIAYGGQVLDGASMRIKGHTSCADAKVKWSVELPSGHPLDFGAPFDYPIDEFHLQNESTPIPRLGWEMLDTAGDPPARYQTFRTQRNGKFFGVFGLLENYDGIWRDEHGYDKWALYKVESGGLNKAYSSPAALAASGTLDKKNPDDGDYSDAWQLEQVLQQPDSASKRAWMYEHLDIPQMVNFTALLVAMRQWDSGGKNFYLARDINGDGRWRLLHWDLDGILNAGADSKGDFITPTTTSNSLWRSLMAVPEIKAMHFRRVRTLHDEFLKGDGLVNRFDELTSCCGTDVALDNKAWGTQSLSRARTKVVNGVQERRDVIAAHTNASEIPTSQSAAPNIVINEIQYAPAVDGDAEYIELYNPSQSESVDLSGWTLEGGIGPWAIPAGTVILPGSYLVFDKDDAVFRSVYGGNHLVGGQYDGGLSSSGESVILKQGARVVDSVTYGPADPWPAAANGTGPSLELKNPTLDNALPTSWAASTNNGTPGALNTANGGTGGDTGGGDTGGGESSIVALDYGSSWKYDATGPDLGTAWRAPGYDDSSWASGKGSLGFRNSTTTTIPATVGRRTYYFRSSFTVPSGAAPTAVALNLIRDDGAVVYLNGTEVARSNMTTSTVKFTSYASAAANGDDERTPVSFSIPPTALVGGTNTIAVEVHQKSTGDFADLTMDAQVALQYDGSTAPVDPPTDPTDPPVDPPTDPVDPPAGNVKGLWHMDETSGSTTMVDASGRGHNGAIGGNVTLGVAGHDASNGYRFDGTAEVRVPNHDELNPGSQDLTLSAWLKVPATLGGGDYNVIQKGVSSTSGGNYKMEIVGNATSRRFGFPDCAFNGANDANNLVYGPTKINDGKWHLVTCNLTATEAYVTVDGTAGPKATRQVDTINNTVDLTVGGKPNSTHNFVGDMDEVSLTIG